MSAADSAIAVDGRRGRSDDLVSWIISGVDQLQHIQWFFSIGNRTIDLGRLPLISASADDMTDTLSLEYRTGPGSPLPVEVSLDYQLGSDGLTLDQDISITNISGSQLDTTLFAYVDLELFGTPGNDSAIFDPISGLLRQTDGASAFFSEWAPAQPFDSWQVGPDTIDNQIRSGAINANTGLSNTATMTGPGDIGAALAFDLSLGSGQTAGLAFDTLIELPLPASAITLIGALIGLGLIAGRSRGGRAPA